MQIYEFDSNLKKETVLKNTVSNMVKENTVFFIMSLICIIAPIIVEIIAFMNYKDTSPGKPFMIAFFGSIFLLYGAFFLGFTISKSIPEYGKRKNETFAMDNEKLKYTYFGKAGKYARLKANCSLTVKFEDLIEAERDVVKNELRLKFYDTEMYRAFESGKRDTSKRDELILPLYFNNMDFVANTIENECYQRNRVEYEENYEENNK